MKFLAQVRAARCAPYTAGETPAATFVAKLSSSNPTPQAMLMKTIRITFLLGLTCTAISLAAAEDNPAIKKDMAQLQGEWSMVSGTADGQPMPEEMRKQMKRVCRGDEITVTAGGQMFLKAKVTLDPSKQPKTIDYEMTDGFTKGKKQLGIYELDGDTFKSCFGAPGAERPKDFTSQPGDKRTSSVWKREKK
jgi:uncharacterized protein (TIGR03067 family)